MVENRSTDCVDQCALAGCSATLVGDGVCHPMCVGCDRGNQARCAKNPFTGAKIHAECRDGYCDEHTVGTPLSNGAPCTTLTIGERLNTTKKDAEDGGDCKGQCNPGCAAPMVGDGLCQAACNVTQCGYDDDDCIPTEDECAAGCPRSWQGDGICDAACRNADCGDDHGDCEGQCAPGCEESMRSNGICDEECMNKDCQFDSLDGVNGGCGLLCGDEGCLEAIDIGNGVCEPACRRPGCSGEDAQDCAGLCAPGCESWMKGDLQCDADCNVPDCDNDGGDCFECSTGCTVDMRGDGWNCDPECNVAACDYDALPSVPGREVSDCEQRRRVSEQKPVVAAVAKPAVRSYARRSLYEPSKLKVSKDPDECRLYKSSFCIDIDSEYRCNANAGGAGTTCDDTCDEATGCTPYKNMPAKEKANCFVLKTIPACFCVTKLKDIALEDGFGKALQYIQTQERDLCYDTITNLMLLQFLGVFSAVVVVIVNTLLKIVLKMLAKFEKHSSLSEEQAALAVKLFACMFINMGLISLLVNANLEEFGIYRICLDPSEMKNEENAAENVEVEEVESTYYYATSGDGTDGDGDGDGESRTNLSCLDSFGIPLLQGKFNDFDRQWHAVVGTQMQMTMFINVFVPHAAPMLQYFLILPLKRMLTAKSQITQRDLNALYEGPEFNMAINVPNTLVVLYTCMMYSSGMPTLILVAMFSFLISFWVDKFMLLRMYKKPPQYDAALTKRVVGLLPTALFLKMCFGVWFFGNSQVMRSSLIGGLEGATYCDDPDTPELNEWNMAPAESDDAVSSSGGIPCEIHQYEEEMKAYWPMGFGVIFSKLIRSSSMAMFVMLGLFASLFFIYKVLGRQLEKLLFGLAKRLVFLATAGKVNLTLGGGGGQEWNPPFVGEFCKQLEVGDKLPTAAEQKMGWSTEPEQDKSVRKVGRDLNKAPLQIMKTKKFVEGDNAGALKRTFEVIADAGIYTYNIEGNPKYKAAYLLAKGNN